MNSGRHSHTGSFGMTGAALDRVLNNPLVKERLLRPRKIIRDFDQPYVGGYSSNGEHIYLDRHLPEELKLELDGQKRTVRPITFLAEYMGHEPVEWSVMDALGWSYGHAHSGPATGSERRKVLRDLGPGWWQAWQHEIEKYVKADAHEKITKMPADYDMRPLLYPPVNHKLVDHVRQVMGGSTAKKSKHEVEYTDNGHPGTRCKDCEHFQAPQSCEKVRGKIARAGWCLLWDAK